MAKDFNDFHYFVYVGNNKSHAFRNYTNVEGKEHGFVVGYDKNGQPVYKAWQFDNGAHRQIRVHKNQVDKEGLSAVDFLRNSPECAGSPNGMYDGDGPERKQYGIFFREVDDAKDARTATDTRKLVVLAQAKALELKGQDLVDVAAIIGVFSPIEEILTFKVLDFASNFPDKFTAYLEDPARKTLSLVRKAINAGVFKTEGRMIKWENEIIGVDEAEAVAKLIKDEKLNKAVTTHLSKLK